MKGQSTPADYGPAEKRIQFLMAQEEIRRLVEENRILAQLLQQQLEQNEQVANRLKKQEEVIQLLKDEIAILKGQKPKPNIPPSKLEGPGSKRNWMQRIGLWDLQKPVLVHLFLSSVENATSLLKRRLPLLDRAKISPEPAAKRISKFACRVIGKVKKAASKPGQPQGKPRKKKTDLIIHETIQLQKEGLPEGAIFKGYRPFHVQELQIKAHNIRYLVPQWQLPDGKYLRADLPAHVGGHYGPHLVAYVLQLAHTCRVPEHLIVEQLRSKQILISAGQVHDILTRYTGQLAKEVSELLPAGIVADQQIQVDDVAARHRGQNQNTRIIGNRHFTIFCTSSSKSRINFLHLLQGGKEHHLINDDAISYLKKMSVPEYLPGYLSLSKGTHCSSSVEWRQFLAERNLVQQNEVRLVTEAALYAGCIDQGLPRDLRIHSDGASQFDLFIHSLCWVHEERHYRKLLMTTDQTKSELEKVKQGIWALYRNLTAYQASPDESLKQALEKQFDELFQTPTHSSLLNDRLKSSYGNKEELLRVLDYPTTPLHNNSTETCARAAKIKLKISGGTRSDLGRQTRDTFLSLKQTCRKLGINFLDFLQDRVAGLYQIPHLAVVILQRALICYGDPAPSPS